jgi:DNA-directed RNA polymerase III subunit RPC2
MQAKKQPKVEKWELLPYFMQLRNVINQHIYSFDHFVEHGMRNILLAEANVEIRSSADPDFYMRYIDVSLGPPSVIEDHLERAITPYECRIRDLTYAAPIFATIRFHRDDKHVQKEVVIGKLPIMLRSRSCVLHGADRGQNELLKECYYDPGGYFVIKGTEKVILMQEQLSNNRVIIEKDGKSDCFAATITSDTYERKSRCSVVFKGGCLVVKHNTLGDDFPLFILFRAMGVESELEMMQLIVGRIGVEKEREQEQKTMKDEDDDED